MKNTDNWLFSDGEKSLFATKSSLFFVKTFAQL